MELILARKNFALFQTLDIYWKKFGSLSPNEALFTIFWGLGISKNLLTEKTFQKFGLLREYLIIFLFIYFSHFATILFPTIQFQTDLWNRLSTVSKLKVFGCHGNHLKHQMATSWTTLLSRKKAFVFLRFQILRFSVSLIHPFHNSMRQTKHLFTRNFSHDFILFKRDIVLWCLSTEIFWTSDGNWSNVVSF